MKTFREISDDSETIGIGVDIINTCNVRCVQCFYEKGSGFKKMLSLDQIRNIIKKSKGIFSEIYILGGEPTLHPDILEILKTASKNMKLVVLVTNGLKFVDENFCAKIAEIPNVNLHVHRRAISEDARDLIDGLYGKRGSLNLSNKAWHNIQRYWQDRVNVQLNLINPLVKEGHALEVFKWARKAGFQPMMELVKSGPLFDRGNPLDISRDEVQKFFEELHAYDLANHRELAPQNITPPYYGKNCTLIETGIHVTVNGNVIPCVSHCDFIIGNIFNDEIETILNCELRSMIKKSHEWIVGPCVKCEYFAQCKGGCRGEALWSTGCPRASNYYCWHIPKELSIKDMVPATCKDCVLERHTGCKIKV